MIVEGGLDGRGRQAVRFPTAVAVFLDVGAGAGVA